MMSVSTLHLGGAAIVGVGATLTMDLWGLLSHRLLGMTPANYCLVGRWFCHMPERKFRHWSITHATPKPGECFIGWLAHYLIGIAYALVMVALTPGNWLDYPTFWIAIVFSLATLLFPFFIMQPSFGLGPASARSSNPTQARVKSALAHVAFGVGLYISALPVSYVIDVI